MKQQSLTPYYIWIGVFLVALSVAVYFAWGYYSAMETARREKRQARRKLKEVKSEIEKYRARTEGAIVQSAQKRLKSMHKIVDDFRRGFFGEVNVDQSSEIAKEEIEGIEGIDPVRYRKYTFTVTLNNPALIDKVVELTERLRSRAILQEYQGQDNQHQFTYQLRTPVE